MLLVPTHRDREWFGTGSLGIRGGVERRWNRLGGAGDAAGNSPATRAQEPPAANRPRDRHERTSRQPGPATPTSFRPQPGRTTALRVLF